MNDILPILLPTLALAIVINLFFRRLDLPTILGYIMAGTVMTTVWKLDPGSNHTLHEIAELGIVFLMFTIGLEFSVGHLIAMRREVLLFGGLQVLSSAVVFGGVAHIIFELDVRGAILVGSALALSSTAIVLKFLNENREIDKPYGRTSLGILLFQDLAVIPMLLMIRFFSDLGQSVPILLLKTGAGAVVSLGALWLVGRYLLPHFLRVVSDARSHEIFVGSILLVVVSAAFLTHALGLSYSLGAFFAGLMIAESQYKYQIEADLVPFRDLLLGVFFTTVGMQIQVAFLLDHWLEALLFTAGLMLLKGVLIFAMVRITGQAFPVAVRTGLALAQGGGFSFAVFAGASGAGLLAPDINQILIIVVVFSMVLTPFILQKLDKLAALIEPKFVDETDVPMDESTMHGNHLVVCGAESCTTVELGQSHVVVCGYGRLGRSVMAELGALGYPCVAIEQHRQTVDEGIMRGDAVIFGNAAQHGVLEKAWVKDASAVVIALEDEHAIHLVGGAVAQVAREPLIVVRTTGEMERELFRDIPIKSFVDEHREVARILIDHALVCENVRPYVPAVCRACESGPPQAAVTPVEFAFPRAKDAVTKDVS
ncbi:MAG: cation:proton antiporter [Magnetococcales bacterium]|nr:cation:proton antiporter [Magnetococcales bacterium]